MKKFGLRVTPTMGIEPLTFFPILIEGVGLPVASGSTRWGSAVRPVGYRMNARCDARAAGLRTGSRSRFTEASPLLIFPGSLPLHRGDIHASTLITVAVIFIDL